MTSYSTLYSKIESLGNLIAKDSISPVYLSSLLREIVELMQSVDVSDSVRTAFSMAKSALANSNEAVLLADSASSVAESAKAALTKLTSENLSEAIDNFNEIIRFLDGFKDDETLAPIIKEIRDTLRSFTERLGKFIVAEFDGFADTVSELGSAVDEIDEMRPGYEVCYVRDINRFVYCDKVSGGSEFTFKWPLSYLYNRADGQARTDVIYLYGTNQFYHKTSGGLFRLADLKDLSDASAQLEQKVTQTKGELTESLNSRIADVLERLASTDSSAAETRALLGQLKTSLEALTSGDVTDAIDNYNEIIRFLDGFKDDESLAPILKEIRDEVSNLTAGLSGVDKRLAQIDGLVVAPFVGFCDNPDNIYWIDKELKSIDGFHIGYDNVNNQFFGVVHLDEYAHCESGDGSYDFEGEELYKGYDGHPRRDVLYRCDNELYRYTSDGFVRFADMSDVESAKQSAFDAWSYAESVNNSSYENYNRLAAELSELDKNLHGLYNDLEDECLGIHTALSDSISENSDNIRSAVSRIAGLENKAQTQKTEIEGLRKSLDTLTSGNVTDAIESFNEIVRFLNGFRDDEELAPMIKEIKDAVDSFRARFGEFSVLPFGGFADSLADYGGMDAGRIEDTKGWHVCYLREEDRFVLVCHDDTYPHCSGGDYTSDWPGASLYNGDDGRARRDAFYLCGTNQLYHRTDEGMFRLADMNDLSVAMERTEELIAAANAEVRESTGIYPFDGFLGSWSELSSHPEGNIYFITGESCFHVVPGSSRENRGLPDYNLYENGPFPSGVRKDRLFRCGNRLYYANDDNMVVEYAADNEMLPFIRKWQTVYTYNASYNPAQGSPFIMNGVSLSYEEAMLVDRWGSLAEFRNCGSSSFWGASKNLPKLRTTVPSYCHDLGSPDEYPELCWVNESLEVVKFAINATTWQRFRLSRDIGLYSGKVGVIDDILEPTKAVRIGLVENDTLEKLHIYKLKYNLDLRNLKAVSLYTLRYLVDNSANGSNTITVTVHPDIFEKMSQEQEWIELAEDAAAKNISFATV